MKNLRYYTLIENNMAPAQFAQLQQIYFMDEDYTPLGISLKQGDTDGVLMYERPDVRYKIDVTGHIPGFGTTHIIADNGGCGYAPDELADGFNLNVELAKSRIKAVEDYIDKAKKSGVSFSCVVDSRMDKAKELIAQAGKTAGGAAAAQAAWDSLAESMYAGEQAALERARQAIEKAGPRPEFKFGAKAFEALKAPEEFTKYFYDIFNIATLPFYTVSFEPEKGDLQFDTLDKMVAWCERGNITPKGHPLTYLHKSGVPKWLEDKTFNGMCEFTRRRIREIVPHYKSKIKIWDVINEAHDVSYSNELGFTREQFLEITKLACDETKAADPGCTAIINNTEIWGDYGAHRLGFEEPPKLRNTPLKYVTDCVNRGFNFDVIGLQLYYPARDMFEIERILDKFGALGKGVHITEHGISSAVGIDDSAGNPERPGEWHGEYSQKFQADYLEQLWTIAVSKPYMKSIIYWDFTDSGHHFWPYSGFLDKNNQPKEVYYRLQQLIKKWMGK